MNERMRGLNYTPTPDTDLNHSRYQVGDTVEIVDPYNRHSGHVGKIIKVEWGRHYFKRTWAYEVEKCSRFFGPWQLKRVEASRE